MPIPASQIVQVNPRLISAGGNDLEFNALFLTDSGVIPLSQFVLRFASADDVGAYFGEDSTEYLLASRYFLGYSDSFAKPAYLYFAPRVYVAQAAFIRGGECPSTLAELQAISEGEFTVTLGGKTVTVSSLNFATATSFSAVGAMLQTKLQAADTSTAFTACTVTYSSVFKAFTITSGETGEDEGLTIYPSGAAATLMGMTEETGAVLSVGSAAMTPTENMNAILEKTKNFVCFMSITKLIADQVLEYSTWAGNQGVEYLHVYWDNDTSLLTSNPTGTISAYLEENNVSSTVGVYGDAKYAAFVCSIAASIDYDRTNGTITFKFKGQSGLGANVTNATAASNLEANGMNFVGNYATRNDEFVFFAPGQMFGEYKWIDTYLNAVWLNNAIQVACMEGFSMVPRVPYTEEGYSIIKSWIQDPVNRALKSGVIEPGVELSEAQKTELQREAGRDISSELYSDGYVIQISDPGATVRAKRGTPSSSLWYCYGAAVHKLTLASTVVE